MRFGRGAFSQPRPADATEVKSSPANAYKTYKTYKTYNQLPMAKRAPSYRPKRLFAALFFGQLNKFHVVEPDFS